MFYLYGNTNGLKLLDKSKDEEDLLDTISYYIENNDDIRFYIIERTELQDKEVATIRSIEDFIEYNNTIKSKKKVK